MKDSLTFGCHHMAAIMLRSACAAKCKVDLSDITTRNYMEKVGVLHFKFELISGFIKDCLSKPGGNGQERAQVVEFFNS